eukprot:gene12042-12185_t
MEIAEPTIAQAVGRCIAAGAKHVIVAPYFLSKGRHIQDDIPALVAAAGEQFPDITCSIAEPIGIDPLMVQLMHNRVRAALPQQCPNLGTAWGSAPLTKEASPVGMAVAAVHKQEQKHAGTAKSRPILTSLPLQVFIYFGGWWDVLFWVLCTIIFIYKGRSGKKGCGKLTSTKGNKTEQSAPLLFSMLLTLPMIAFYVYFIKYQTYVLKLEVLLNAISLAFSSVQQRLQQLLPIEYMQPIDDGLPSYLQWGFACVRSRACQVGPQAFGMIPFVDLANHAGDPNADRFMAQYGFVPDHGNRADRLELDIPTELSSSRLRMSHVEEALGAGLLLDVARGNNPYIFAAMKSLPLKDDKVLPAVLETTFANVSEARSSTNSGSSNSSDRGTGPVTEEERVLAGALIEQVLSQQEFCGTTLLDDEQLLRQLQQQQTHSPSLLRLAAAVRYRIERKRLLNACQVLLNVFVRS